MTKNGITKELNGSDLDIEFNQYMKYNQDLDLLHGYATRHVRIFASHLLKFWVKNSDRFGHEWE